MDYSFLFPAYNRLTSGFTLGNNSFAHYTNAPGLIGILESQSFWLSNARDMNDLHEIEHGMSILEQSLLNNPIKKYLSSLINNKHPNLFEEVESELRERFDLLFEETYIACFSIHQTSNPWVAKYGRLSLWKEYSGNDSIALILKPDSFFTNSSDLNLILSPVVYADLNSNEFRPYIYELIASIEDNIKSLADTNRQELKNMLLMCLICAVCSIKHPAFYEEREWRVIHLPELKPSPYITKVEGEHESKDKMQVPLIEIPQINYFGASPTKLIKKIIIGPPLADSPKTYEKIKSQLIKAGFNNLNQIVSFSNIPFREINK